MEAFDFGLLENDLIELEHNLRKYGSKPVKDEISLNQLFKDHLASGGSRTRAVLALAAGYSQSLKARVYRSRLQLSCCIRHR